LPRLWLVSNDLTLSLIHFFICSFTSNYFFVFAASHQMTIGGPVFVTQCACNNLPPRRVRQSKLPWRDKLPRRNPESSLSVLRKPGLSARVRAIIKNCKLPQRKTERPELISRRDESVRHCLVLRWQRAALRSFNVLWLTKHELCCVHTQLHT